MPRIERTAEAVWEGNLARGAGALAGASSGAFSGLPYRVATRTGDPAGETSPEELLAGSHAGCYAMSLAAVLTGDGTPPERLEVRATCVMDEVEGRHLVVASELDVRARVPDAAEEAFLDAVGRADERCPISTLIRGTADVRVEARLE